MALLDRIIKAATAQKRTIALGEGEDIRIIEAALYCAKHGIARTILLGSIDKIKAQLTEEIDPEWISLHDPAHSPLHENFTQSYFELRKEKGVDLDQARLAMLDPVQFAAMMVRMGKADGTLSGAVATTAHVVRSALTIIGKAPNMDTVSSFMLLLMEAPHHLKKGFFLFSDCALLVEPSAKQLSDIAMASADSYQSLIGLDDGSDHAPAIAMLSFSSKGSAKHERVSKVQEALQLAKDARNDLNIDGELQFDAAFLPEIGQMKAPESKVAGHANIFIFPNLESGNIGYKIAERIGGARVIGPILQGLAAPANDLSRGCSAMDAVNAIAITAIQAK